MRLRREDAARQEHQDSVSTLLGHPVPALPSAPPYPIQPLNPFTCVSKGRMLG